MNENQISTAAQVELCVSLCEATDPASRLEDLEALIEDTCTEAGFPYCERIYAGSYFCENYFLSLPDSFLDVLRELCARYGMGATLVIPIFGQAFLESGEARAHDLLSRYGDIIDETVVNDVGAFAAVAEWANDMPERSLRISLGRLFSKELRDARYPDVFDKTSRPSLSSEAQACIKAYSLRHPGISPLTEVDPGAQTVEVGGLIDEIAACAPTACAPAAGAPAPFPVSAAFAAAAAAAFPVSAASAATAAYVPADPAATAAAGAGTPASFPAAYEPAPTAPAGYAPTAYAAFPASAAPAAYAPAAYAAGAGMPAATAAYAPADPAAAATAPSSLVAMHLPLCYATTGRNCSAASCGMRASEKFRMGQGCSLQCLDLKHEYTTDEGVRYVKHGRTLYYPNPDCRIAGVGSWRIVYAACNDTMR